jgi:hypothetical protein
MQRERSSQGGARRPLVVVDEAGAEVGVLVDYAQYVVLLKMVSSALDRGRLPRYWRGAMDDCLALAE